MLPKGGTLFFLLILVCDAGKRPNKGSRPDRPPPGFKNMARKLMMDCVTKGYKVPTLPPPENTPENSDVPDADRRPENSTLSSNYQYFLSSVSSDDTMQSPANRISLDQSSQLDIVQTMGNFTSFTSSIKLLKNTTEKTTCFLRAYVAPMCWKAVLTKGESLNLADYDTMLWCAKPMVMRMSPAQMLLPRHIKTGHMGKMTNMLKEVCEDKSEAHKAQVIKWVREQIAQNFFNCTLSPQKGSRVKPSSKPPNQKPPNSDTNEISNQDAAAPGDSVEPMTPCEGDLKWLNLEAMQMLGPCLLRVSQKDVEALDNAKLCEFFKSDKFKHAFSGVTRMKPSVGKRFLTKISDCFSTTEKFTEYVDRLGILACYYKDPPENNPAFSKKLLSQLQKCENPESKKMKRDLVKIAMSQGDVSDEMLSEIGSNLNQASAELLAKIPKKVLKKFLKAQTKIKWSPKQQRELVKIQLGDKKCSEVTGKDLLDLQSTVAGASRCIFKNIKPEEVLQDVEGLRNMSRFLKNWQMKALLRKAKKAVNATELVMKVNGRLLRSLSLESVARANLTLSQSEGKEWSHKQALLLANIFNVIKTRYRKLGAIMRGVTCKKINKVANNDVMEFAQALTDSPQLLSKRQVQCVAWRLFGSLEKKRPNYFQTITEEELDEIPTLLLFCLPPAKVEKLPDSVCGILLDKIADANLTLVPPRAPSRRAITQKALYCLTDVQGKNISSLTIEQLTSLGSLLCEIQLSQLRLMNADVRKDALKAIGSCPPKSPPFQNGTELLAIVKEAYGDPSDFLPETVTMLGQVVLSDEIVAALPNKPEMKESVAFLLIPLSEISDAARKKLFELTIASQSAVRRKRQTRVSGTEVPTVELIMELDKGNIDWTVTQLEKMEATTFIASVDILGAIHNFSPEQLEALKAKAIEALGPVEQMTETVVLQMGCINAACSATELEELPLQLDTLNEIGKCGWNQSQMEAVWKGVAQRNNLTAQSLEDAEIISLDTFLCGLSLGEIEQLNMDAFKEAVDSIAELKCSMQTTKKLKSLAVSAYGEPKSWTPAYVASLGNVMAALSKDELMSLDPSVFEFLKQSSIQLIPAENFASLSVAQLQSLGPDNAAMVTDEQRAALDPHKLSALDEAVTGAGAPGGTRVESGTPSISVEGISSFMKPFMFLLLGFLLL